MKLDLLGLSLMWLLSIDDCRNVEAVVNKFVNYVSHVVNVDVRKFRVAIQVTFSVAQDQYINKRNFEEDVAACVSACGQDCMDKCIKDVEQQYSEYINNAAKMTLDSTVTQFASLLSACNIKYRLIYHAGTTASFIVFI
jgi:hypothetical protein